MATGENGSESSCTAHGIVLASFKCRLYSANFPFRNATTICSPFGLQHAQLYSNKREREINKKYNRKKERKKNRRIEHDILYILNCFTFRKTKFEIWNTKKMFGNSTITYCAFSDLFPSNIMYSSNPRWKVYAPNVPSQRQTAITFRITGFHRICLTLTSFDTDAGILKFPFTFYNENRYWVFVCSRFCCSSFFHLPPIKGFAQKKCP